MLSQFTGAARELPEALVVNPYDADQCATALDAALTMPLRDAARADAADARPAARVQRVPLGGPHASRRGECATARPLRGPAAGQAHTRLRRARVADQSYSGRRGSLLSLDGDRTPPLPRWRWAYFLDVDGTLARARAHARRGAGRVGHAGSRARRARDHRRCAGAGHRTIDRGRRSTLRRGAAAHRRPARTGATGWRRCVDGGRKRSERAGDRATPADRRRGCIRWIVDGGQGAFARPALSRRSAAGVVRARRRSIAR